MKTIKMLTILCAASLLWLGALTTPTSATEIPAGPVTGTWTAANNPYNINGEINVPANQTLTIEPGVQVIFQGHYKFIVNSNATLLAVGTAADSIRFTAANPTTGWFGIRFLSASNNSRIEFCILKYGKANTGSEEDLKGGAIYCSNSSPSISHSTFQANSATYHGGGIYCSTSSPIINGNNISGNSTIYSGGGIFCISNSSPTIIGNNISGNSAPSGYGGGICCSANSSPIISGNTVSGNSASNGGGIYCNVNSSPAISGNTINSNSASYGGGIACISNSNPSISGNTFSGNSSVWVGGGIYCGASSPTISGNNISSNSCAHYGGGIYCYNYSNPIISSNTLSNNSAFNGGGIYCYNFASPSISGNTIIGNSATEGGGAFLASAPATFQFNEIRGNSSSGNGGGSYPNGISFTMNKNTIAGNTASAGGGLYSTGIGTRTIINSIIWGNSPQQISGSAVVTYSDIQGDGFSGTGNLNADPLFVNATLGDYHLQAGSPCINTGDPSTAYNDPDGSRADMGAYYFPIQAGDISGAVTPAFPDLLVELFQNSVSLGSTLTASGAYSFPDLDAGDYTVELTVPAGYAVDANPKPVAVVAGQTTECNFNLTPIPSRISGTVASYMGGGRTVNLLDLSNNLVNSVVTSVTGAYEFTDLDSGGYQVQLVPPSGWAVVGTNTVPVTLTWDDVEVVNFNLEPILSGIVGTITPNYAGLTVDLFDASGLMDTYLTAGDGAFAFANLDSGSYLVELVVPLGFQVTNGPSSASVLLSWDETETVSFALTPIVTANDARSKGYWKHQVNANGYTDYTTEELLGFSQDIFDHFYGNPVNPIQVSGVTYVSNPAAPLVISDLQYMLNINQGGSTLYERACQQYLTLLLNIVSNKVGQYTLASPNGATHSQAVVYIHDLLTLPGTNYTLAKSIAETLNNAQMVANGVIPLTTPNVIFGNEMTALNLLPSEFSFGASPNPFNPTTVLSYQLPVAGLMQLAVYDIAGHLVAELIDGWREGGSHEVTFDGSNLASGIYLARLQAGNFAQIQKLVLMK